LPFVMPLMSVALIAFIAISFSLIFFSFEEDRSWIVAAGVALLVFGGAFVLAFLPQQKSRMKFLALVAVVLSAVAALGVIGLVRGEPVHGGEHGESHSKTEAGTHSEG
jgi:O-antigen/teichoic acid export membrane protein